MLNTKENNIIKVDDKEYEFKNVKELFGHTDFKSFEGEFDNDILYADGIGESVVNYLLEPIDFGSDMNTFNQFGSVELYLFDGWYVAMK